MEQNPQRKPLSLVVVNSSVIRAVGYDEQQRRLEILFTTGRVFCYEAVPMEVYTALLAAVSPGEYWQEHVMEAYSFSCGSCKA